MPTDTLPTYFAPAERAGEELLKEQSRIVCTLDVLLEVFDAVPSFLLVLNDKRQILFSNEAMESILEYDENGYGLGLRAGEVLKCIHSTETAGGCGTTESCRTCGAVLAILNSQKGRQDIQECRISREPIEDSLDLQITATPFELDSEKMTIFVAEDISHQKRRTVLERTFFHDILNTAGGLHGLVGLLDSADPGELDEFRQMIHQQSDNLINEIKAQRELLSAERDQLTVHMASIRSGEILRSMRELYENHEVAREKNIKISSESEDVILQTDRTHISRVIGNMLKNALEAVNTGETVVMRSRASGENVVFQVHNPTYIPPDIQRQIFQRSFSTKGSGRGTGTYSIKLFGERYLKGKVSFTSTSDEGTTFEICLPSVPE